MVLVDCRLSSFPQARLNFRRRPIWGTTLYRKQMQAPNFAGRFDQLSLSIFLRFSPKIPLYLFYTRCKKKLPKVKSRRGRGTALKGRRPSFYLSPVDLPSSISFPLAKQFFCQVVAKDQREANAKSVVYKKKIHCALREKYGKGW